MRTPTREEQRLISSVESIGSVSTGFFEVTETQLQKGIVDANQTLAESFAATGLHEFSKQSKGSTNRKLVDLKFLAESGLVETTMSLYRPETKDGDPRLWIYRLPHIAPTTASGDLVMVVQDGEACAAINISEARRLKFDLASLKGLFGKKKPSRGTVAAELLDLLQHLAVGGPLPAVSTGDNAVGLAVEAALGIKPNSDKGPDYKGIELKSGESLTPGARKTLFSIVPTLGGDSWRGSPIGGYRQMVKEYGYLEQGNKHLQVDVDARRPQTRTGLQLRVDEGSECVQLLQARGTEELVAVWGLDDLASRLGEKHSETFWIEALPRAVPHGKGGKGFQLARVHHTSTPRVGAIASSISDATIWVSLTGRYKPKYKDHGCLWKLTIGRLHELFKIEGVYPLR